MPALTDRQARIWEQAREREASMARRRQVQGVLLLAACILLAVLLRAPSHWLFLTGWWRF